MPGQATVTTPQKQLPDKPLAQQAISRRNVVKSEQRVVDKASQAPELSGETLKSEVQSNKKGKQTLDTEPVSHIGRRSITHVLHQPKAIESLKIAFDNALGEQIERDTLIAGDTDQSSPEPSPSGQLTRNYPLGPKQQSDRER